jgi:hypothetical protein
VNLDEKIEPQEYRVSLGNYYVTLDPKRKGNFTIYLYLGAARIGFRKGDNKPP